jgi:predicted  nucleic acid-binding Zn-ribbon protein
MPHQCLKCGHVFEEGSSQLLKGCPRCGGNRFFFTKEPIGDEERNAIVEKVGKDINSTIMDLMQLDPKDVIDKSGNWLKLKPKDVRKAFKQHLPEKIEKKEEILDTNKDLGNIIDEEYRRKIIDKIKTELEGPDVPETIDIEKPGRYNIDLKGLLEKEPVIIQKDGSYIIHLPSIFKLIDEKKI